MAPINPIAETHQHSLLESVYHRIIQGNYSPWLDKLNKNHLIAMRHMLLSLKGLEILDIGMEVCVDYIVGKAYIGAESLAFSQKVWPIVKT